jgi:uncharacterized protein
MLFVIDTNIFVSALSATSPFHWVIESLIAERYEVCISHDILLEYEEVLSRKYGAEAAQNFIKAMQELPTVHQVDIYFNWNLLDDPDDNKFVDAAIAGRAEFIVSEDRDFRKLQEVDFPKVGLLRLNEFKKRLFDGT